MISYTTVEYYIDSYLMGRMAAIDAALFPTYALKATMEIKKYTLSNADKASTYPDELQMCCCEIAELIYKAKTTDHTDISSEKVGEYSVSYESQSAVSDKLGQDIRSSVYAWLAMTGLLYRGCN